jgi:capsular polysaccharide biosynthesis protein
VAETISGNEVEFSQQLFNTYSTVSQQPEIVDFQENESTVDKAKNTETKEFIQHTTKDEGERVGVEQFQFDDVLQIAQNANSSTTTTEETSSSTNSLNSTSQQKAFTNKYQPVEVLNSEGEWVSGYWVHKCLVVANLEGIERKYALYDESGSIYAFWGEIRLPRVK